MSAAGRPSMTPPFDSGALLALAKLSAGVPLADVRPHIDPETISDPLLKRALLAGLDARDAGEDVQSALRGALKGQRGAKQVLKAVSDANPDEAFGGAPNPATQASEVLDGPQLSLTSWAELEAEAVQWAEGGISAVGALNIFAGDGGVGKTRLIMSGAAARTQGQRWPVVAPASRDGIEVSDLPHGVLFCGAEDAVQSVLLPAFLACGGNKAQVQSIDGVFVPLRDGKGTKEIGFDLSERAMQALDAKLAMGEYGEVIIDGITGYIEGDGNGDTETRRSLLPLVRLLRKHRVIGSGLMHFGKGTKKASDKLIMSVAFRNVARTVYYVVPDPAEFVGGAPERPDFRRLVFNEKCNGGALRDPFGYRIMDTEVPGSSVRTGAVSWDKDPVLCTLNDALAAADAPTERSGGQQNVPQTVLTALLTMRGGWAPAKELLATAEAVGIPERTLQHAKNKLELQWKRLGAGPGSVIWWGLPGASFAIQHGASS